MLIRVKLANGVGQSEVASAHEQDDDEQQAAQAVRAGEARAKQALI